MAGTEVEQNSAGTDQQVAQQEPAYSHAELVKHPLQHSWTLWYLEPDRSKSWEDSLNTVATFNTVEDFWSLFNHIKQPSEVKLGSDYSLFKEGIRPMWEDQANKRGGRWVINLSRGQRLELDRYWIDAVLCLIGEAFESIDDICGAVVNIRQKGDKISIWTSDGQNRATIMEIGMKLKQRLNLPEKLIISYQLHNDTMVKSGSTVKSQFNI